MENYCIRLVIYLNCTMMHGLTNLKINKFYVLVGHKYLKSPNIRANWPQNIWSEGNVRHSSTINPLKAELNPICHLLVLLGDLTFMGPCIVSIFQYISNNMQRYTVYLYLETALHVSDGTSTHHQERIRLYLQHLVFVTPLS